MPHAIAWPAAALACGIAVGVWTTAAPAAATLVLLVSLGGSFACIGRNRAGWLLAFVLSGWGAAGVALGSHAEREARRPSLVAQVHRLAPDGQIELIGRLRDDASIGASGVALGLEAESVRRGGVIEPAEGGVRLTVLGALADGRVPHWRAGRRIRVTARVREPSRYHNQGVPDHRLGLARSGTVLVGSVKSAALVEVTSRGSPLEEAAAAVRQHVRDDIARAVGALSPRSAAIVSAVLIGDRAGLGDEVERRLQEAGTYHVIAISGGNIAVFAVCLLTLARAVRLPWRAGLAVTALGLLLYGEIAIGGSSVTRAIVVALVYLAATALDQRSGAGSALAIAALLILCATPLALLDAGFLLTFGATIAILTGARRIVAAWRSPRPAALLAGITAASLATEVALLPVGALFFSRVTFAGPVLNLAAVPLMSVVQIGGIAAVLSNRISPDLGVLTAWVPHLASEGLVRSAALVEYLPWLTWRVAPPPWWLFTGYYVAIAGCLVRHACPARMSHLDRLASRLLVGCAAGIAGLVVSTPLHTGIARPGGLRTTVLDVGQGDATLLQTPDGRALLVDAGGLGGQGRFDIGERVLAPALWSLGVRRLDTLVVTHGDPDHIGGAPALVAMFGPREVWEGVPVPAHGPLIALTGAAAGRRAMWRGVRAGDELHLGAVTIRVLHPPPPDWERQRVRNDDSIVLDVRYGDVSVILPGDIGSDVERALVGSLRPAAVRVLKVAHHGSATSTSAPFVEALRPQIAIVSCGRENRFGHPVPAVLERLQSVGARVYRTDHHGAVTIETDGKSVRATTDQGPRKRGHENKTHENKT